ncbi:hypothetical protein KBX26_15340 [Micromonospora sp. C97]|uniref:hypothetical protein n=1 Tax=Micromonospora sp. C97 TaxID=2824883 RepID=UPI001B397F81|nr:hypothetical protein [Micromonospora sp. C97]MBQ1031366.1 hypothetical protein [Micromonospora sp. C97]
MSRVLVSIGSEREHCVMTSPPKLRSGNSAMLQLVQLVSLAGIGWYAIIPSFYETNG